MNTIGGKPVSLISSADFRDIYKKEPKPIVFWDTCGLLEYIRFIYRKNNGIATLNSMLNVAKKIVNGDVYSVASELSLIEWDDNEKTVVDGLKDSLLMTESYHALAMDSINMLTGAGKVSYPISIYNLEVILKDIALNIAEYTRFICYEDVTDATVLRAALKQPPAHKKHEIKDCAVWETMLQVCHDINTVVKTCPKRVFYTVNTDDFADKSRTTPTYMSVLLSEATLLDFDCALTIDEVNGLLP